MFKSSYYNERLVLTIFCNFLKNSSFLLYILSFSQFYFLPSSFSVADLIFKDLIFFVWGWEIYLIWIYCRKDSQPISLCPWFLLLQAVPVPAAQPGPQEAGGGCWGNAGQWARPLLWRGTMASRANILYFISLGMGSIIYFF